MCTYLVVLYRFVIKHNINIQPNVLTNLNINIFGSTNNFVLRSKRTNYIIGISFAKQQYVQECNCKYFIIIILVSIFLNSAPNLRVSESEQERNETT